MATAAVSSTTMPSAEELMGRLLEAGVGSLDMYSIYLGDQLGYYRVLHESGPLTSVELAECSGTNERYAREWLEQQATTGILAVDDPAAAPQDRRFTLPAGYEAILVDPLSDAYLTPISRLMVVCLAQGPALVEAFRTGGGVSWSQFGDPIRSAQADFNRAFFTNGLVPGCISQMPALDEALQAPGARVAEIGSGAGWAAIALAKAYPNVSVSGFDIDGPSVEMARANLQDTGVEDRVTFNHQDAGDTGITGEFDLVCAFECIHDMPDPVSALRTMRRLVKPGGTVLVMDERVADKFGDSNDLVERLFYGASLAVCLPDGMSHQPSVGTGTVMRTSTFAGYADAAGFSAVEVLPIEHPMFWFYVLHPAAG